MPKPPPPPDPARPNINDDLINASALPRTVVDGQGSATPPSTLISWGSDTAVPGLPSKPATPTAPVPARADSPLVREGLSGSKTPGVPASPTALALQLYARKKSQSATPGLAPAPAPVRTAAPAREASGVGRTIAIFLLLLVCAAGAVAVAIYFEFIPLEQSSAEAPTLTPLESAPTPILTAREVFQHLGENVRVEFVVRDMRFSKGQMQTLYLSAADVDPQRGELRVVILPEVLTDLVERKLLRVQALDGASIRVRGVVVRDKEGAEICISDPNQLEKAPRGRSSR